MSQHSYDTMLNDESSEVSLTELVQGNNRVLITICTAMAQLANVLKVDKKRTVTSSRWWSKQQHISVAAARHCT